MISNTDKKTETFFRKQNEALAAVATSFKSIEKSLQRLATNFELIEKSLQRIAAALEKIAAKEEIAAVVDTGAKEDDDGRTSA